jgi:hypothetical protein
MHVPSLRRLALGAAVTGAAIGAVPALASAASSCSFEPNAGGIVTVKDDSGPLPLELNVVGTVIAINDSEGEQLPCFGGGTLALTTNTNQIRVTSKLASSVDGYIVDESEGDFFGGSPEVDGVSEVETLISNTGVRGKLFVVGTPGSDYIAAGGNGGVTWGSDGDTDVSVSSGSNEVEIKGGASRDTLVGLGNGVSLLPAEIPLRLLGEAGADFITGGHAKDVFDGGADDDIIDARDSNIDKRILGGFGFDDAFVDSFDPKTQDVEAPHVSPSNVGRLRLAPKVLKVKWGHTARLKMSWTAPRAWRDLRKVELSLYDGKKAVGMINVRPASGRLGDMGMVRLMPGSSLGHHGKTVTARLALRLKASLAGHNLRVDVQATDKHGHKQLERDAGTIKVGR